MAQAIDKFKIKEITRGNGSTGEILAPLLELVLLKNILKRHLGCRKSELSTARRIWRAKNIKSRGES